MEETAYLHHHIDRLKESVLVEMSFVVIIIITRNANEMNAKRKTKFDLSMLIESRVWLEFITVS